MVHADADAPLSADAVRADVFMGGRQLVVRSTIETDGGTAWKQTLPGNALSFEGVHQANQKLDVTECQAEAGAAHRKVAGEVERRGGWS